MPNQIKIPTISKSKYIPDVQAGPVDVSGPAYDPLSNLVGEEPTDLMSLIVDDQGNRRSSLPDSAIKNRAAYAALLSGDPDNFSQIYQSVVSENQQGLDYTREAIMQRILPQVDAEAKHGALAILADPRYSDEQKLKVINSLNDGFIKDSATIVANNALAAASKGETPEAEDVRISGADALRGVHEYKQYIQGITNRHEAMRAQDGQAAFFVEFLETMLPFATNKNAATNLTQLAKELKVNAGTGRAFILPGSIAKDINDALKSLPPEQRLKMAEKLYPIIENNKGIIFTNDNKFMELEQIKKILSGDYSNFDKLVDNASGVLDLVSLGLVGTVKSGIKRLTSLVSRTPEKVEQKVIQRSVGATTSPVSPMSVVKEANPEQARQLYAAVAKSEGDEVAQAVTGTTRDRALASEALPQPKVVDGTVESKLVDPDAELRRIESEVDPKLKEAVNDSGGYYFTQRERVAATAHILNDVEQATGLTVLDNMASVGLKGDRSIITAMFGTPNGGFKSSEEAFNQARLSLREYGITDRDIQLFKKIDGEYVPITREEAKLADGNYTVGVDFEYNLGADDIPEWEALDVKRNFFDRLTSLRSNKAGTVANHMLDSASMLHPHITGSATVATDRAVKVDKLFLEMHNQFSDGFVKLPKARQAKVYEHLKEANQYGLELSDMDLLAKGFSNEEIDLVKQWRKNWDTHFYFENADMVRSLDNAGYRVFEDANLGNKFYARPIAKNGTIEKIYDPASDTVRNISRLEMDQLYDAGGHYAQFRRPVTINGVEVEHMMVRNTPTEYLRKLGPTDQILNYRKGYFQVGYKAPHFIEEIVRTSGGAEKYRKVVSMAGSTEEANHIRQRLATSQGRSIEDFSVRGDVRDFKADTDWYWDLQHASGRIAQRHRGKLLETSTSALTGFDAKHILDPVESAIRASRSLSGRIAMRDTLEVMKQRAIAQYGEFFPKVEGQVKWPENSNSLVSVGKMTDKQIADARTTVEYINYLQHGYDNALDEGYRGIMNVMGKLMANLGSEAGEKAFIWAQKGHPVNLLKQGVFQAYIALNPLRQAIVQSHQAVRMLTYNPAYVLSGKMWLQGAEYLRYASGLSDISKASQEAKDFYNFVKNSGMLDAVDKHNLVRGSLSQMAETAHPVKRVSGAALSVPRKVGFDWGEQSNLLMHLGSVYDNFKKAGKNLADPYIRDEAYSLARALSYDMNRAGDMPYNSNVFGLFLQFMQVPHKAIASVTTNRRIPGAVRLRMAAGDIALFGVPGGAALANWIGKDMLPADPDKREAVLFGLTSWSYNKLFTHLAGTDTKVDFSSLSPYGMDGFQRFFEAILSGGLEKLYTQSPAATFYFNENSRMRTAMERMFKYLGFIDTEVGHDPQDIISVAKGVAELSSGWSNMMKARQIMELGKLNDKQGVPLAHDLNTMHAVAQAFGLSPLEVKLAYEASLEKVEFDKKHKDDVNKWYKNYVRVLASEQKLTTQDPEFQNKVLGAMRKMYEKDPVAMQIINQNLSRDVVTMRDKIVKGAIDYAQIPDSENHAAYLKSLGILENDPEYQKAIKLFDDMKAHAKQVYGDK